MQAEHRRPAMPQLRLSVLRQQRTLPEVQLQSKWRAPRHHVQQHLRTVRVQAQRHRIQLRRVSRQLLQPRPRQPGRMFAVRVRSERDEPGRSALRPDLRPVPVQEIRHRSYV